MKMEQWTELESLEPQIRARSNTWPLPRPENCADGAIKEENGNCTGTTKPELDGVASGQVPTQVAKRNSSRKNAWGNLSYADLITQAIGSAPEKRLTLSQIYEWMIQNVPYFKDKGESNSSAGWKNSIRHNLSLHNKFMRIQNIGHGKSSWWMINPDVKTGKSTRRRAASMETSKFEKKRGRVRKKVEVLRNGLITADATSSPGSSISEGSEIFPESPLHSTAVFQLSPDIRPRDSSSASSCGRLSPIPAAESEWIDSFSHPGVYSSEQVGGYLAENMKTQQGEFANNATPESEFNNSYPGIGQAALPYEISQCPLHRVQGCGCTLFQSTGESHSPDGVSPVCPQSEPSSDSLLDPQMGYDQLRQPSNGSSSTIMGQLMGALNSSMTLSDLNLNIDTFHGGFDCNVDEVIRHELSMDGSLDFNFSQNQIGHMGGQTATDSNTLHPLSSYSTTLNVTGSSDKNNRFKSGSTVTASHLEGCEGKKVKEVPGI